MISVKSPVHRVLQPPGAFKSKKNNNNNSCLPCVPMFFLLSSCDMSLHGKLVVVASRRILKFFFLKSNDVLDAVLSTDLGEQRCFKLDSLYVLYP